MPKDRGILGEPRSGVGPEASRDHLANLDHPEILFRLVICERNRRIEEKIENLPLVFLETTEKVLCRSGLGSPPGGRLSGTSGFRSFSVENYRKCGEDSVPVGFARRGCPGFRQVFRVEKEVLHLRRPEMAIEILDGRQIPEEMGVAERMLPGVGQIRSL